MALDGFLFKPRSESNGNLVILFPASSPAPRTITIRTQDGQQVTGTLSGRSNGNRPTYRFDAPGSAYGSNITVQAPDGTLIGVSNGGQRADAGNVQVLAEGNQGGIGDGVGDPGVPNSPIGAGGGASVGRTDDEFGFAFPQADFSGLGFERVNLDPLGRTAEVGAFNTQQFQNALRQGIDNALDLVNVEAIGLINFNRIARQLQQEGILEENQFNALEQRAADRINQQRTAEANIFNIEQVPQFNVAGRQEIGAANRFNQQERLAAVDVALPQARAAIEEGISQGRTLSSGRLISDIEDRGIEAAARNVAAEGTLARGFGDDSVFGRRTSDLLSAQQRLDISQIGDQKTQSFLQLGSQLNFDQPIKQNPILAQPIAFQPREFVPQQANLSQQIPGAPSIPASQLAVQQQSALTDLTTIQPEQVLSFDFQEQAFNSEQQLKVDLEKLNADVFSAQQESSFINAGIQQGISDQRFGAQLDAGQDSSFLNQLGQLGGIISSFFSSEGPLGGLGRAGIDAISDLLGIDLGTGTPAEREAERISQESDSAPGENQSGDAPGAPGENQSGEQALTDLSRSAGEVGLQALAAALTSAGAESGAVAAGLASAASAGPIAIMAFVASNILRLSGEKFFGSGKSPDQQRRDSLRSGGQNVGIFFQPSEAQQQEFGLKGGDHYIELADGSFYNVGADGGGALPNYGTNVDGKTTRNTFDIDWSDPRANDTVSLLNPVALMIFGAGTPINPKMFPNGTAQLPNYQVIMGHLWNATTATNNSLSQSQANIKKVADDAGLTYSDGLQKLKQFRDSDAISQNEYLSMVNQWNTLMLSDGPSREIII